MVKLYSKTIFGIFSVYLHYLIINQFSQLFILLPSLNKIDLFSVFDVKL